MHDGDGGRASSDGRGHGGEIPEEKDGGGRRRSSVPGAEQRAEPTVAAFAFSLGLVECGARRTGSLV